MSNTARSKQFTKNKRRISAIRGVFNDYKSRAKSKGVEWALTFEMLYSLVTSVCAICGKKPTNKINRQSIKNCVAMYNGIDRIDNSLGYIEGNVRTCCKLCNAMKSNLKERVFKKHLIRIAQRMAERKQTRRRS